MTTADDQPHGERRCYQRGCRREECVLAHARYCKQYLYDRHRHGRRRIDGTPAAEHLRRYVEAGWSRNAIANYLDVSVNVIGGLVSGRKTTVTPENARRILAFDPDWDIEHPGPWTYAEGTTRRLRALAVLGHPLHVVGSEAGISYAEIRRVARGERQRVTKVTAARVKATFESRRHMEGPSGIARAKAIKSGWLPEEVWADIDDPQCQPTECRNELAAARRTDIRHLASFGIPEQDIAARLGMSADYVTTKLRDMRKAA